MAPSAAPLRILSISPIPASLVMINSPSRAMTEFTLLLRPLYLSALQPRLLSLEIPPLHSLRVPSF